MKFVQMVATEMTSLTEISFDFIQSTSFCFVFFFRLIKQRRFAFTLSQISSSLCNAI